ncbi:MAG: KH domain-containing protein [Polyangiaceae bacterium]|nr:KH domain-containing protein [Polyangiaceae bacterium]
MTEIDERDELEDAPFDEDENLDDDYDADDAEQPSSEKTEDGPRKKSRKRKRRRGKRDDVIEPQDDQSALALEFVANVVEDMEMNCEVQLRRPSDDNPDEINIHIVGADSGRVIGKKGQVLQALQFLTHRVVNRPGEDKRPIMVDAEGYRSRRDDNLASMARKLGHQAVDLGKIITFEPMNPRDRRVVHMALAKIEGVVTKSEGEGDGRRVQIIPVRR